MHKMEIVRFIEVNKHFWSLQAIKYFVVYFHYCTRRQISVTG